MFDVQVVGKKNLPLLPLEVKTLHVYRESHEVRVEGSRWRAAPGRTEDGGRRGGSAVGRNLPWLQRLQGLGFHARFG